MQRLSQQIRQLQKLSPQQIQLMKLLQVPTSQLDDRIKEELQENPALEMDNEPMEEKLLKEKTAEESDETDTSESDDYISEEEGDEFDKIDISEYVKDGDDEDADYNFQNDHYAQDGEDRVSYQPALQTSFYDFLLAQVNMLNLDERETQVANFVIGSLDDDGYLRRDIPSIIDDLAFRQNIETSEKELFRILRKIQDLEPAGVAARDLRECLLLQLRKKENSAATKLCVRILEQYFDEFTKKHYEKIQRSLSLSDVELKEAIQTIIHLNPKPGALFSSDNKMKLYVLPDFFVYIHNGVPEIQLNQKNAPDLRVSSSFRDMLKDYDRTNKKDSRQKEAVMFIKQKIDSARWFIDAVKQRQDTLLRTMTHIVELQHDFFVSGDETALRPMILKDIADLTGLDISTISRVVNSKYVQTEFGTFKLKYFFSEAMTTDSGEEVSTREVKKILGELIGSEEKKQPLSDEKLTELLHERGYTIARRTVAKYREQLNLPVARLRKEL